MTRALPIETLRNERLRSRLMGLCEGFEAGASRNVEEQEDEISILEGKLAAYKSALKQIGELSTGWPYGMEGVCLLRIHDIAASMEEPKA